MIRHPLKFTFELILVISLSFLIYIPEARAVSNIFGYSSDTFIEINISSADNQNDNSAKTDQSLSIKKELSPRVNQDLSTSTNITDPKFNTIRNNEVEKSKAKFIVLGLIIVASVVPFVTWRFLKM